MNINNKSYNIHVFSNVSQWSWVNKWKQTPLQSESPQTESKNLWSEKGEWSKGIKSLDVYINYFTTVHDKWLKNKW